MSFDPATQSGYARIELVASAFTDFFSDNFPKVQVEFPYNGGEKVLIRRGKKSALIRMATPGNFWLHLPSETGEEESRYIGDYPEGMREQLPFIVERLGLSSDFKLDSWPFATPRLARKNGNSGSFSLDLGNGKSARIVYENGAYYAARGGVSVFLGESGSIGDLSDACRSLGKRAGIKLLYEE